MKGRCVGICALITVLALNVLLVVFLSANWEDVFYKGTGWGSPENKNGREHYKVVWKRYAWFPGAEKRFIALSEEEFSALVTAFDEAIDSWFLGSVVHRN